MADEESRDKGPITIAAQPGGPSVTMDPQDPLPESDFRYRRWTTWAMVTALLLMVAFNVWVMHDLRDERGIYGTTRYLLLFAWFIATYYYVAPSAEQLVRIIHTARIAIGGLQASAGSIADHFPHGLRPPMRGDQFVEQHERPPSPAAPAPASPATPAPPPGVASPPF